MERIALGGADLDGHFIHPLLEADAASVARTGHASLLLGALEVHVVGLQGQVFEKVHVGFFAPRWIDELVRLGYHVTLSAHRIGGLGFDRSLDEVVAFFATVARVSSATPTVDRNAAPLERFEQRLAFEAGRAQVVALDGLHVDPDAAENRLHLVGNPRRLLVHLVAATEAPRQFKGLSRQHLIY